MVRKKVKYIFLYLTPFIIIFGVAILIVSAMIVIPKVGIDTESYRKVMGVQTVDDLTGEK